MKILKTIQDDLKIQKIERNEMEERIKTTINKNIDEKFKKLDEKTFKMEKKIQEQEDRINQLERTVRRKNLIFFGLKETERSYDELVKIIIDLIVNKLKIPCEKLEIDTVRRLGRNGSVRPIVVTFSTTGKKIEILKNRAPLKETDIYVKEDFPKNVLEKRKELQKTVQEEKEKGNQVFIKYDKIIYPKERKSNKRTLSKSASPEEKSKNPQAGRLTPNSKRNKYDITRFLQESNQQKQ